MTSPDIPGFDAFSELQFALTLADLADEITLPRYTNRSFSIDRKPDRSEVTQADREAEALGGRGGGRPDLAQAGGNMPEDVAELARQFFALAQAKLSA